MKYFLFILLSGLSFPCLSMENQSDHTAQAVMFPTLEKTFKAVGTISFEQTEQGLRVRTDLKNLPAGEHGFHIHYYPDCAPKWENAQLVPAGMAGGHYDPDQTEKHLGPGKNGHKGDLPVLNVQQNGTVKADFVVSHLRLDEIKNRSIIIHEGGDNFSDTPLPLGGGGTRIACGVIK